MGEHIQGKPLAAVHNDVSFYSAVGVLSTSAQIWYFPGLLISFPKIKHTYTQILVSHTYSRIFRTHNFHKPPSLLGFLMFFWADMP